jgi:hypothetical protein
MYSSALNQNTEGSPLSKSNASAISLSVLLALSEIEFISGVFLGVQDLENVGADHPFLLGVVIKVDTN